MASSNFFLDNEDLLWEFKHGINWSEILNLVENGYSLPDGFKNQEEALTFYEDVLKAVGEYTAKEIAPKAAKLDKKGTHLKDGEVQVSEEHQAIFDGLREMGVFGLCAPRELGGSNCSTAMYMLVDELLGRADSSVMTHFGFHGGVAAMLHLYSIKEGTTQYSPDGRLLKTRFAEQIQDIVAGGNFGCMCLTEPEAGSDLGAIRTKAVERDGKWYLTGEKIFITSGHGQYQLVIAKTEEQKSTDDGLKAISLFLVPRKIERDGQVIDNVKVTKCEEKLGHHGSATVSLLYEESEGELIGRRGQGFELMLYLMNLARVGVGFEAIGNSEAAWRAARDYAAERKAMGKTIDHHELIAEKLLDMETWICGLRALAFEAMEAMELALRMDMKLKSYPPHDEELAALKRRYAQVSKKARRLTPLVKYMAAEKAVEIARDAIQIHGGMGFITETGVDKYLRDAMVLPIYEGTSQIQSLMATKDQMQWAMKDPAGFLRRFTQARLEARTAKSPMVREVRHAEALCYKTIETILLRIVGRKMKAEWDRGIRGKDSSTWGRYIAKHFMRSWDMKADFSYALLHAERLTKMLADVAIGTALMKQAERFPERRELAERFIHKMSLRVEAVAREIEQSDDSVFQAIARLDAAKKKESA